MSRIKVAGLMILAGLLAITPAAFAFPGPPPPPAGFGGGGGFHGGVGHLSGGSHFSGHYGWHGGNYGHYWRGGHWYGGRYYYGDGVYWSGYPYGYGYYDANYDGYPDYYADSQTTVTVTTPSDSAVVAVQKKLAQLGYYQGPIDGIDGPETQKAIRWFQSVDKITVTGQIDSQTLSALQIS